MQERLDDFERLGAEIVVISFVSLERLAEYQRSMSWPFRLLADPERAAYREFGLEQAGWLRLFRPRVIWTYLRLMFGGRMPKAAREDVHQLGGDFVLDRHGRIVYAFRSRDPADRPPVSDLLDAVRQAVSASE